MPTVSTILWRRLDRPGHDACRLVEEAEGWRLEGTALFQHTGGPAQIHYRVLSDRAWRTLRGELRGWVASEEVESVIIRSPDGAWTMNGVAQPQVASCQDLDLGFTPATNLLQLCRLRLSPGETADFAVAWFDVGTPVLELHPQRYERLTAGDYAYGAPTFGYAATLEVTEQGFIARYPGLWEMEAFV